MRSSSWDNEDRRYLARKMHADGRGLDLVSETLGISESAALALVEPVSEPPTVSPEARDKNDARRIRNALREGLDVEAVCERLDMKPNRFYRLTASAGLTHETRHKRLLREQRERVQAMYDDGVGVREIAKREGLPVGNLYRLLDRQRLRGQSLVRKTPSKPPAPPAPAPESRAAPPSVVTRSRTIPSPPIVRGLFEEGYGLRAIAERLSIDVEDARRLLRQSYPDTIDSPLEATRAGQRARFAASA